MSAESGKIEGDAVNGFTFRPDNNFNGEVTLNYLVVDEEGGKNSCEQARQHKVNDEPTLINPTAQSLPAIQEEGNAEISSDQLTAGYQDEDGDKISIQEGLISLENPEAGTITGNAEDGWIFTAARTTTERRQSSTRSRMERAKWRRWQV